jgi:glycosyltransferase involved in cell wall biosynthesis
MNILWITNVPTPEASLLMGEAPMVVGGWIFNSAALLSEQNNINLFIAFPKNNIYEIKKLYGGKITYFIFNYLNYKNINWIYSNKQFDYILELVKPDLVHIFGTEYPHTLSAVNACNKLNIKVVISIQGLASIYSKHYMAFLPNRVQTNFTFRDFLKRDNLRQQQKKFEIRGEYEIEALKKVSYVIGRTTWDKACTTQINPTIKYYSCNETLREEFYKHVWSINDCERNSIFISQATYPIKGLHLMLEAMPLILKSFPKAKLYVAGYDITKGNSIQVKLRISSYGKYIKELIIKNNLREKIIFTGILNEKQICERYLKSHVFACPSSIENSPNSLGEAMLLGVPCVASDVGGVSDMLTHKEEGFIYQSDAPYMLAYYICEIFNNNELAIKFSKGAREHALKTHDKEENLKKLLNIYKEINNT